jgi:hypothetical protein
MAGMSRLPSVLFHSDLPQAELHAAKLDGELYRVDQCFSPIDEIESRLLRARALFLTIPPRLIVEQRSAAWVYGAARLPTRHQFCADITARVRPATIVALSVREVVIDEEDLEHIAGLAVTTPVRTVVDLARNSLSFDDVELDVIGSLMRIERFGLEECRAVLDRRRNLPHKTLAVERIGEALRRIQSVQPPPDPATPVFSGP